MDGQTEAMVDQDESQNEPIDIAQAFRMYNQQQQKTAEDTVEEEGSESEALSESDGEEGTSDGDEYSGEPEDISDRDEDGDSSGGSSSLIEPIDLSPAKQDYLKRIQNQAVSNVRKQMADDQIELWSMKDIYEKDEDTGRVTFHNPDDPQHPFASRADAQKFIDSMNKEVTDYFRDQVNMEQQKLVQQSAPVLQMFDFAPVYQQMNETEQGVFNDLIEPYAIKDNAGKVIGFNTNLQAVANTARQIAKRFHVEQAATPGTTAQAGKKKNEQASSRPAMDMQSGNGLSADEEEPKTIGEALKMYDRQQREAKKKGKK